MLRHTPPGWPVGGSCTGHSASWSFSPPARDGPVLLVVLLLETHLPSGTPVLVDILVDSMPLCVVVLVIYALPLIVIRMLHVQ